MKNYSFEIDSYSDSLKKYVNLSSFCWETINSDMRFFSLYKDEISLSGFLNTIFKNSYETSNACVSLKVYKKEEELDSLFSSKEYKDIDEKVINTLKDGLLEQYQDEIIKNNLSFPKGDGHYFRMSVENATLLNDNIEDDDIDNAGGSIGCFLKIIYEEYAKLPQCERIKIYFKEIVDVIEDAIASGNGIKIVQQPFERFIKKTEIDKDDNPVETRERVVKINKYYVKPYKLVTDEAFQYVYLVGLSQQINDDGENEEKPTPHSFRISLIKRATKLSSMNGFISKDGKSMMDKMLITSGPQSFISADDDRILKVKVWFDSHGLEMLQRISYGRPKSFTKLDEHTYVFTTDFYSARNYFWRFANNAKVLEPESLNQSIKKMLKYASDLYNKD